jgi:hypothetical protein
MGGHIISCLDGTNFLADVAETQNQRAACCKNALMYAK